MKIKIIIATITAIALGAVGYLIFKPDTSLPKNPSDFNFIFKYGVQAKNELNTFDQTFTKDMIVDPSITIDMKFTEDEMKNIYKKICDLKLFDRNYPPAAEGVEVTPCDNYYLKIQLDNIQKELLWDDCRGENKDQRKDFTDYVKKIIESKEEYKKLPEPQCGYI